jgi:hypothetical protein
MIHEVTMLCFAVSKSNRRILQKLALIMVVLHWFYLTTLSHLHSLHGVQWKKIENWEGYGRNLSRPILKCYLGIWLVGLRICRTSVKTAKLRGEIRIRVPRPCTNCSIAKFGQNIIPLSHINFQISCRNKKCLFETFFVHNSINAT